MNNSTTATLTDPVARAEEAYNVLLVQLRTLHPDSRRLIDRLDDAVAELVRAVEENEELTTLERIERIEAGNRELRQSHHRPAAGGAGVRPARRERGTVVNASVETRVADLEKRLDRIIDHVERHRPADIEAVRGHVSHREAPVGTEARVERLEQVLESSDLASIVRWFQGTESTEAAGAAFARLFGESVPEATP